MKLLQGPMTIAGALWMQERRCLAAAWRATFGRAELRGEATHDLRVELEALAYLEDHAELAIVDRLANLSPWAPPAARPAGIVAPLDDVECVGHLVGPRSCPCDWCVLEVARTRGLELEEPRR